MALALSRAANIWPLSAAVNYLRCEDSRVPRSHQFMLFWAGLRGAMAFALALQVADDLPGVIHRIPHARVGLTSFTKSPEDGVKIIFEGMPVLGLAFQRPGVLKNAVHE